MIKPQKPSKAKLVTIRSRSCRLNFEPSRCTVFCLSTMSSDVTEGLRLLLVGDEVTLGPEPPLLAEDMWLLAEVKLLAERR
mmetsp:Transcript_44396/g.105163  ORF Transcript_44396/g.105163 Transcript_44396/m.105163 type:complete len:81 (+) Transcript_44396:1263-1505(+)